MLRLTEIFLNLDQEVKIAGTELICEEPPSDAQSTLKKTNKYCLIFTWLEHVGTRFCASTSTLAPALSHMALFWVKPKGLNHL